MEDLRRMMEIGGSMGGMQRSYSKVIKEKKKKNVIIIKPKIQQESDTTKQLIKEKVDIKGILK